MTTPPTNERARAAVDERIINLARRLRPEQVMTIPAGDVVAMADAVSQAVKERDEARAFAEGKQEQVFAQANAIAEQAEEIARLRAERPEDHRPWCCQEHTVQAVQAAVAAERERIIGILGRYFGARVKTAASLAAVIRAPTPAPTKE